MDTRKIIWIVLMVLLALSGCATVGEGKRLATELRAMDFNGVSSTYQYRPTFVEVSRVGDRMSLFILVDTYRPPLYGEYRQLELTSTEVDQYLAFIEKYYEWETLATDRGDMIEKEIGETATTMTKQGLEFLFYSAAKGTHLFVIQMCPIYCDENSTIFYFDKANVAVLRDLFMGLKEGSFDLTPAETVYQ